MLPVQWRTSAMEDVAAIVEFIAQRDERAAARLLDTIDEAVAALPEHPFLYRRGRVAGTRELIVGTNYIVVYCVGRDAIDVIAVLHARRQYP